jgi:hypothetical protein
MNDDKMTNWCLYDDTSDNTWIKTRDHVLRCPICNKFVDFKGRYNGKCCGLEFSLSFGWFTIKPPFGKQEKQFGNGFSHDKDQVQG